MNVSEWAHLWGMARMLFGHEPIQIRVAAVLLAAFTVLMVIEGLRTTFIPRRTDHAPQPVIKPSPRIVQPAPEPPPHPEASTKDLAAPPGDAAQHPYTPAGKLAEHNPKRDLSKPRAQRNMRPQIRRMVTAPERDSTPS